MEKLKKLNIFKKLNLFQQLIVIICLAGLLLFFVMAPLVDYNLKKIIDNQMYETLYQQQEIIINNEVYMPDVAPKRTFHVIYDSSLGAITSTNIMNNETLNTFYHYIFKEPLEKLINQTSRTTLSGKNEALKETYYYVITRLSNTHYLISVQNSDYSDELIANIRNQTIYIQYIFISIVAAMLVIWVISLINPLKTIKKYIDTIKERKQMDLYIDREDEIGVVSKALVDMKESLDKQEKIKEEMIHNISHDLKTPIALIKTYGQSVKDDIYPYGDKDSSMDVILENAERLDHKVKSFLYLNRLDYIQGENKQFDSMNMHVLIKKIVEQMDMLNPDIILETDLEDVNFIGEEEHWRVAIENIIDNASRYAISKISILLRKDYLEIYNDGQPIDNETLQYLFSPYVKGVKGQFGLGLSIVYKIVQMYGYDVKAINKESGVSFIIKKAS